MLTTLLAVVALAVVGLVAVSALVTLVTKVEREGMRERAEQYRREIEWMRANGRLPADWQD